MLSDEQLAPIRAALHRKQKIEAIKIYRDLTHVGLVEAKYAVEQMEIGAPPPPVNSPPAVPLALSAPVTESKVPAGLGCVIILLVLAAGFFGVKAMLATVEGEVDLANRYGRAMGLVLCVWFTVSATLNALNPQKLKLAVLMWFTVIVMLSLMVYQVLCR